MDGVHSYVSAAIAVVLGVVTASLYTAYFTHLSTKNENISDYLHDLKDIENLSRKYWLFDECLTEKAQLQVRSGH
jgi:hypothetical protein